LSQHYKTHIKISLIQQKSDTKTFWMLDEELTSSIHS
jgi:hypothetical protein